MSKPLKKSFLFSNNVPILGPLDGRARGEDETEKNNATDEESEERAVEGGRREGEGVTQAIFQAAGQANSGEERRPIFPHDTRGTEFPA